MLKEVSEALKRLTCTVSEAVKMGLPQNYCDTAQFIRDAQIVANALKAEHHADDGEAIDEAWLRSAGFAMPPENKHCPFIFSPESRADCELRLSYWLGSESRDSLPELAIDANQEEFKIPQPATRGDLRRLCAALGIPLKEQP